MSCGVGHRLGLNPLVLWLWLAAVAPIPPLAWELPYAVPVALKSKTNKQTNKTKILSILSSFGAQKFLNYVK